jgi:hypothetical protein
VNIQGRVLHEVLGMFWRIIPDKHDTEGAKRIKHEKKVHQSR